MKHAHHLVVVLAVAFGAIALVPPGLAAEPPWKYLWFYAPCNFQVDKNVDDLIALMRRARQAGYNGMLTSDHKFGRLHADRPPNYFVNLGRVRQAAAAKVQGVEGIMYTTWRGNYKDLEEFARLATAPRH
jgi:hypothetical protein